MTFDAKIPAGKNMLPSMHEIMQRQNVSERILSTNIDVIGATTDICPKYNALMGVESINAPIDAENILIIPRYTRFNGFGKFEEGFARTLKILSAKAIIPKTDAKDNCREILAAANGSNSRIINIEMNREV